MKLSMVAEATEATGDSVMVTIKGESARAALEILGFRNLIGPAQEVEEAIKLCADAIRDLAAMKRQLELESKKARRAKPTKE